MRNRIDHWCTVEPGNPNPRVHRSSGKLGEASFPTGTVDPRVGISLSPLNTNDGFSLSTATRQISWTEPIMRRDVTTIYTCIRRKLDKGVVSGRSVSHQCVGLYQYTETLGYGDGQLPRVCRCMKKKDEKG